MNTATFRRIDTQRAEDLARLAGQAERKGVRILVDHRTAAHVATSASDPSRCYQVDAERGCTCRGYQTWQRCQHHSLLLSELGQLPDLEQDVVVDERHSERCRTCKGEGYSKAHTGRGLNDWTAVPCSCTRHAA